MTPCRISTYELARVRYPNGLVTSGAGQDYMRRLDRVYPKGAAFYARTGAGGWLILNADESEQHNVTEIEARRVIRSGLPTI